MLFRKTLEDPEEDVCFYTIVALTHFVRRYVRGGVGVGGGWSSSSSVLRIMDVDPGS